MKQTTCFICLTISLYTIYIYVCNYIILYIQYVHIHIYNCIYNMYISIYTDSCQWNRYVFSFISVRFWICDCDCFLTLRPSSVPTLSTTKRIWKRLFCSMNMSWLILWFQTVLFLWEKQAHTSSYKFVSKLLRLTSTVHTCCICPKTLKIEIIILIKVMWSHGMNMAAL